MTVNITTLFDPQNIQSSKATFAFYRTDNGLNINVLKTFKANTQPKLLIALVTDESDTNSLTIADTLIHCQDDTVKYVINAFETFFTGETFMGLEQEDAIDIFKDQKNVHFSYAKNQANQSIEQVVRQAIAKISSNNSLSKLCVLLEGNNIGFDDFTQVSEAVGHFEKLENTDILYALNMAKSFNEVRVWLFAVMN